MGWVLLLAGSLLFLMVLSIGGFAIFLLLLVTIYKLTKDFYKVVIKPLDERERYN